MKKQVKSNYQFNDKWSVNIEAHGFTMIPNLLLENQQYLGISQVELAVLCQLFSFRWTQKNPYPSVKTIAKRSGYSSWTIRRVTRSLQSKGILHRIYRKGRTNEYSLKPLLERLEILATSHKAPRQKRLPHYVKTNTLPSAKIYTKENKKNKSNLRKPIRVNKGFSKIGDY